MAISQSEGTSDAAIFLRLSQDTKKMLLNSNAIAANLIFIIKDYTIKTRPAGVAEADASDAL
jgi:hypothetical protein